jgi:hypothetical protein
MTNPWFIAAGIAALLILAAHLIMGGRNIAKPLLVSEIAPVAKFTHYYCWHHVSITLLAMGVGFLAAAIKPAAIDIAILMTALAGAYSLWSVGLILLKRQNPRLLPQWLMFALIAVLGAFGIVYLNSLATA